MIFLFISFFFRYLNKSTLFLAMLENEPVAQPGKAKNLKEVLGK
jgi:hypothetical protein